VWADREKLGQVLVNLLSNATKFTDPGGRVTVSVAADTAARDGLACLHVTDTGRGIPGDKYAAIFEPFVQLRTGYARATEGTGLGLAISRDLARGMGGDLRVRSVEGEGSTFTVALRRAVTAGGDATDRRTVHERREEERRAAEDRRGPDGPDGERSASGHAAGATDRTAHPPPVDV
jgi:signal transduction histidine kinase